MSADERASDLRGSLRARYGDEAGAHLVRALEGRGPGALAARAASAPALYATRATRNIQYPLNTHANYYFILFVKNPGCDGLSNIWRDQRCPNMFDSLHPEFLPRNTQYVQVFVIALRYLTYFSPFFVCICNFYLLKDVEKINLIDLVLQLQ